MSAEGWGARPLALRLAAFAALAALAGAQWMRLVDAPPVGRVALAVIAIVVGAAALALIAARRPDGAGPATAALSVAAALVATAAGLAAIGIPVHMLEPRGWGELTDELGRGFSGLTGKIEYPYAGDNEWTRLVILAGLPAALGLGAALAFWPLGGSTSTRTRRIAPLVILVAAFAVGATVVPPAAPLLWGALLLAAVAAWLWLPSVAPRYAVVATALVVLAGALAVPIAAALERDEPWVDYRSWRLGADAPASFNWNHTYGPLDWPRDGTELAAMETDRPQYWKAAVLDRFNGRRWERRPAAFGDRLELPGQVEGGAATDTLPRSDSRWVEQARVTLGPVESEFVLGAGSVISIDGAGEVIGRPDGTTMTVGDPLREGDSYSFVSYSPNPTARRLRAAPDAYAPELARYTELIVPGRPPREGPQLVEPAARAEVQMPLRGEPASGDPDADAAIAASPYAGVLELARRVTAKEPTTYDAVKGIERHLNSGRFTYTESPPPSPDPLAEFLLRDQRGYCQQFSGAMALMLRMVGIPSRVVSGFSPGIADPDEENVWRVEDLDAHSWVEVYFPEIGWVTFDPTTSGGPAAGRVSDAELGIAPGGAGADGIEHRGRTSADGSFDAEAPAAASGSTFPMWALTGGLGAFALLGLAVGALVTARRLRYRSLPPAAAADAHLRELAPALVRLGWPLAPADTLLALEDRLRRFAKPAAARYVAKLRAGRYSPDGRTGRPSLAERRALRDDLSSGDGPRARLRGLLALPPGGPSLRSPSARSEPERS